MEQKPDIDPEIMKNLAETGARMYHPLKQLVLCEPVEDGWRLVESDDEIMFPGSNNVS